MTTKLHSLLSGSKTWSDIERETADAVYAVAPHYAKLFSDATGHTWHYKGSPRNDIGYGDSRFTLESDDGMPVHIAADVRNQAVLATPSWVLVPDGGPGLRTPIRQMIRTQYDADGRALPKPKMEAGVSLDRFCTKPDVCARRFLKEVVEPLSAVWPSIQKQIADIADGYAKQDEVADRLAARFKGTASRHGSGCQVSFGRGLPWFEVRHGGQLNIMHTPNLSENAVCALLDAILAETKKPAPED